MYQYPEDGDEVDVITKFKVTANNGLSDVGTVTFRSVLMKKMRDRLRFSEEFCFSTITSVGGQ